MAKRKYTKRATTQLEGFAEDLGRILGTATAKAESWLGQRQQIIKNLTQVRDTASKLLSDLGHQAQVAVRRVRPAGIKNRSSDSSIIIVGGKTSRKRRKMSAKARQAISDAQKARWAKQKAGEKKK
jgi:hypothetical protein